MPLLRCCSLPAVRACEGVVGGCGWFGRWQRRRAWCVLAGFAGRTWLASARREAGVGVWPDVVADAASQVVRRAPLRPSGSTSGLAAGASPGSSSGCCRVHCLLTSDSLRVWVSLCTSRLGHVPTPSGVGIVAGACAKLHDVWWPLKTGRWAIQVFALVRLSSLFRLCRYSFALPWLHLFCSWRSG